MADYQLTSTWSEVDDAAQAVKDGIVQSYTVNYGSTALAPETIYTQLVTNGKKITFELVDAVTHARATLLKAPTSNGGEALFYTIDITNNQFVIYTLSTNGGTGGNVDFYTIPFDQSVAAVLYTTQSLTNAQKAQARANIGAADGASGISDTVKASLLNLLTHVAYTDEDGQNYYDELEAALYSKIVMSISANFIQGSVVVYDTDSLDMLRPMLIVTVTYDDSSTNEVSTYTLLGELTAGTSTITVTYGGKSATFTVTVTQNPLPADYKRIEYVERPTNVSTNAGYNTTGFKLNGTDDATIRMGVMCMETPASSSGGYFLVCRQTDSNNTVGFGIYVNSGMTGIGAYDGQSCMLNPSTILNKKFDLTVTKTSTGMTVTDGTNTNSVTGTPRTMTSNLYIFAMYPYSGSTLQLQIKGRIYYLNIVEGGVEKVNLIPCIRKSDDAVGLYDSVASAFRTSPAYVAGPEV